MAKLRVGQERYYFSTVAGTASRPDGLVEPDPYYLGEGARALGLEGRPTQQVVSALFARREPRSGELLTASSPGRLAVAALDLTFSAPKSVSLLQALAPDRRRDEMRRAHEAAVASAFSFIEGELVSLLRYEAGERHPVGTEGLVAMAFPHRTSRASDPHLHTHVLVANLARGVDGRFSALDARRLFSSQRLVRALFDSELRARLSRLDMSFSEPRRGFCDLAGISRATVREFSRQGVRIEAALAAAGPLRPGEKDELRAVLRPPKDLSRPYGALVAEWRERAYEMGLSRRRLDAVLGLCAPGPEGRAGKAPEGWLEAARTDPAGTASREELCYARAVGDRQGSAVRDVLAEVDELLSSGRLERSGERYVVPGAAERLRGRGEELAGQASGTELLQLAYRPGDRLAALDALAGLAGTASVLALSPGRKAAEALSLATGLETLPVARARSQPGGQARDWVVLAECASLTAGEIEAGFSLARSAGAGVILFGSEESIGRSQLLSPLVGRSKPLERAGPRREPGTEAVTDLSFGRLVVEAVRAPSLACERAARLARIEARADRPVLVLVPEPSFKEAVSAELVAVGSPGLVRVALADRARGRPGETVISVGTLPARRGGEEVARSVLVLPAGRPGRARQAGRGTGLLAERGDEGRPRPGRSLTR